MLRAGPEQWHRCAGCLAGEPAFILGNGPSLPCDLTPLDGLFTVGVNRILYRYDPTVVQWFDANVERDIGAYLKTAKAVPFTNREINWNGYNCLDCVARQAGAVAKPLERPDQIPVTGSSGVSGAYWAMCLGCDPIYLVGMSACTHEGKTDFYGVNRHHTTATMRQLRRALRDLLTTHRGKVFPVPDQDRLNELCGLLRPLAKGREWYLDRFRSRHSRLHPGKLALPAAGGSTGPGRAIHRRGEPRAAVRIHADRDPVGGLIGLPG